MIQARYSDRFVRRRTTLFLVLSALFLTNALLAELVGVKIFSAENTFGFPKDWLRLGSWTLEFNLTAGALIWPIVFITTDVINEYFGPKGVRKISFLTAGLIVYAFILIFLVTRLVPADFWLQLNARDAQGQAFDINFAFTKIYSQGLNIILGSITAFLISQLLDAWVFSRLRRLTGSRKIWLRATGSTLVSQLIDSFVVLYIAFALFGNWSMEQVFQVGFNNYVYKFVVAVVLTPLLYLAHALIDRYLGLRQSEQMQKTAARDTAV
jgi:uncharacterized integral membrane protein (TIGR00697 family)